MAIENFVLRLVERRVLTPNVHHLGFDRVDQAPIVFIPGQFITLLLKDENGALKRRSYSIATDPSQSNWLEMAISYISKGFASEKLLNLGIGEELDAMGPVGRLILQDEPVSRYILVGTGTGIAPYRSMIPALKARLEREPHFEVVILQGVPYRTDILYDEDFKALAESNPRVKCISCLSRECGDLQAHEHAGRVQSMFADLQLTPGKDVVYLCGNPNMIDEAFAGLTAQGFSSKDVRREKYISSN